MSFEKLASLLNRAFFVMAFVLLGFAVIERVANEFGYTIVRGLYTGGRLFQYSTVPLMFVVALQLREIREALRLRRP